MGIGHVPELRRAYGFDEVAIAPGDVTINPDLTSIDFSVNGIELSAPILASAVDAIASPSPSSLPPSTRSPPLLSLLRWTASEAWRS